MHEFANLYSSFPSVRNQLNFQQQIPHLSRAFDRDRIDFLIRQNNNHERQHGHQVFRRLNDYYGLPQGTKHQCCDNFSYF
jgi:hypothetical protein